MGFQRREVGLGSRGGFVDGAGVRGVGGVSQAAGRLPRSAQGGRVEPSTADKCWRWRRPEATGLPHTTRTTATTPTLLYPTLPYPTAPTGQPTATEPLNCPNLLLNRGATSTRAASLDPDSSRVPARRSKKAGNRPCQSADLRRLNASCSFFSFTCAARLGEACVSHASCHRSCVALAQSSRRSRSKSGVATRGQGRHYGHHPCARCM